MMQFAEWVDSQETAELQNELTTYLSQLKITVLASIESSGWAMFRSPFPQVSPPGCRRNRCRPNLYSRLRQLSNGNVIQEGWEKEAARGLVVFTTKFAPMFLNGLLSKPKYFRRYDKPYP